MKKIIALMLALGLVTNVSAVNTLTPKQLKKASDDKIVTLFTNLIEDKITDATFKGYVFGVILGALTTILIYEHAFIAG
jgi:hypothetical protein